MRIDESVYLDWKEHPCTKYLYEKILGELAEEKVNKILSGQLLLSLTELAICHGEKRMLEQIYCLDKFDFGVKEEKVYD